MKFGVFDYIEGSNAPLHKTYEERMALIQGLETAGFYGYHLSEHHATPLSMTPSPSIFLAAAARETQSIRLGTLLYLLPLYHPLRLLEELCMLDHLSGGRLDIGVGRGISPHEFEAFGESFEQSGPAFEHAFNVLYQGFTRDRIDYSCDRFTFKDTPVVLKPMQNPHPPFWYGLRGDQGPVFAAQRGMNGVTLGPDERVAKIRPTATIGRVRRMCAGNILRRFGSLWPARCAPCSLLIPMTTPNLWRARRTRLGLKILPGSGRCAARSRRSRLRPISTRPKPRALWWLAAPTPCAAFSSRRPNVAGTITSCCCWHSAP
jgi:alkanesulfonate monooxygenase SsuD/methylene tetrahydromethanopterin reductase-like flavin-dependent oxidoreductase (luciferase family)